MANKKRRRRGGGPAGKPAAEPRTGKVGAPRSAQLDTKKAKRDDAKRQRQAALRRIERRRRLRRAALFAAVIASTAFVVFFIGRSKSPTAGPTYASGSPVDPTGLPGIQTGNQPWQPEISNLDARLTAIGLHILPQEGSVLHIHQHLDLFIDGQPVTVPAGIGIEPGANGGTAFSPLHTHQTDGVIHVESDVNRTFTLGEFFDVWGVKFTPDCIGGYCNAGDKTLKVFVDGKAVTRDPQQVILVSHEEIVVAYGTPSELPSPIPSSHTFPVGE